MSLFVGLRSCDMPVTLTVSDIIGSLWSSIPLAGNALDYASSESIDQQLRSPSTYLKQWVIGRTHTQSKGCVSFQLTGVSRGYTDLEISLESPAGSMRFFQYPRVCTGVNFTSFGYPAETTPEGLRFRNPYDFFSFPEELLDYLPDWITPVDGGMEFKYGSIVLNAPDPQRNESAVLTLRRFEPITVPFTLFSNRSWIISPLVGSIWVAPTRAGYKEVMLIKVSATGFSFVSAKDHRMLCNPFSVRKLGEKLVGMQFLSPIAVRPNS